MKLDFKVRDLMNVGMHYGHLKLHLHPSMRKFTLCEKDGISIIDLNKTYVHLKAAIEFVKQTTKNGGNILFVSVKKPGAADIVKSAALKCGQHYVNSRWLGGTMTNWKTISKSLKVLANIERILTQEESIYTKKEKLLFARKRDKLNSFLGGIKNLTSTPDILFVVDVVACSIAIKEAKKLGIPVVGIVDTNADPSLVDYPIPANDDGRRSIAMCVQLIADAVCVEAQNFNRERGESHGYERRDNNNRFNNRRSEGYNRDGNRDNRSGGQRYSSDRQGSKGGFGGNRGFVPRDAKAVDKPAVKNVEATETKE